MQRFDQLRSAALSVKKAVRELEKAGVDPDEVFWAPPPEEEEEEEEEDVEMDDDDDKDEEVPPPEDEEAEAEAEDEGNGEDSLPRGALVTLVKQGQQQIALLQALVDKMSAK